MMLEKIVLEKKNYVSKCVPHVILMAIIGGAVWTMLPRQKPTAPFLPAAAPPTPPYVFPSKRKFMDSFPADLRMKTGLLQFAAPNDVNCGSVSPNSGKSAAADACAATAFKSHQPFRLMYAVSTKADNEYWGIVRNQKGQVFFLHNKELWTDPTPEVLEETVYLCKKPILVKVNDRLRIACSEKPNLTP
jgi:hypothetical protein